MTDSEKTVKALIYEATLARSVLTRLAHQPMPREMIDVAIEMERSLAQALEPFGDGMTTLQREEEFYITGNPAQSPPHVGDRYVVGPRLDPSPWTAHPTCRACDCGGASYGVVKHSEDDETIIRRKGFMSPAKWSVQCHGCGTSTRQYETVNEAISAWNRKEIETT